MRVTIDDADALHDAMLTRDAPVPTGSLARLWRTGRSAAGLASALRASRRGDDLDPAAVAAIVERLGALKGVAMKVGQMLGYVDQGLPEGMRAMLATLQTAAPATPFEGVAAVIEAALGARAAPLLAGLERAPLAVASVGQVHRARLADGREVAVKVRHPGVEAAFRADFRSASFGRAFAALLGAGAVGPVIEEARTA
ncbi:MAG: AarF/UbiB family protein, partial [Myxococcota bacterium]